MQPKEKKSNNKLEIKPIFKQIIEDKENEGRAGEPEDYKGPPNSPVKTNFKQRQLEKVHSNLSL